MDGETYLGDPSYRTESLIATKNMDYGRLHEKRALDDYLRAMKDVYATKYDDVEVSSVEVAFYINHEATLLASPDGEVTIQYRTRQTRETNAEFGLVELKCPVGSYFADNPTAEPRYDINAQKYPGLLRTGKNANIPAPRFSLARLKSKQAVRRQRQDMTGEYAFTVHTESPYKTWYIQCLCNLFVAPNSPLFIDLCIWTAPSAGYLNETHTWWFKERSGLPTEPYPNMYVERFYRDDPLVLEDWGVAMSHISDFYVENALMFERNIRNCLRLWNANFVPDPDSAVEPPCPLGGP